MILIEGPMILDGDAQAIEIFFDLFLLGQRFAEHDDQLLHLRSLLRILIRGEQGLPL